MAPREYRHRLDDILEAISGIENAVRGKTLKDYEQDWLLRHGVQRGIEIISEASRAIPAEMQALRPEIPWQRVRGIGNVLRHDYHGLTDEVLWDVSLDAGDHAGMLDRATRMSLCGRTTGTGLATRYEKAAR